MKRTALSHKRQPNTHKKVSLSTLSPHTILQIAQQFTQQNPPPTTRGRKPNYPEALILTLLAARHNSYRALLALAHAVFPEIAMPALGTLCYRFGRVRVRIGTLFWSGWLFRGLRWSKLRGRRCLLSRRWCW